MNDTVANTGHDWTVHYGSEAITFNVEHRPRKTMAITVHPDLQVEVIAPINANKQTIQKKVARRAGWILRQRRQFMAWMPKPLPRTYQSGETHRYLGRQYQLKMIPSNDRSVKLKGRYLEVRIAAPQDRNAIRKLVEQWYRARAGERFARTLNEAFVHLRAHQLPKPKLRLRKMAKRWGSCTSAHEIILNPDLVKTPSVCVEYVIVHELCHLRHPNHSLSFFQMLDAILPDWQSRKRRLEQVEI
jgi:predicted metal-dependent hydrolase